MKFNLLIHFDSDDILTLKDLDEETFIQIEKHFNSKDVINYIADNITINWSTVRYINYTISEEDLDK